MAKKLSIRALSNGEAYGIRLKVCVVDERSEIAACYKGIPQNDVGDCTDVMDMIPKSKGIMMMLRAMSPRVIAVDEINRNEDIAAPRQRAHAVPHCYAPCTQMKTASNRRLWRKKYLRDISS